MKERNPKIKVLHVADKFGVGGSSIHGVTRLFSWWLPAYDKDRYQVSLIGLRKPDGAFEHLKALGIDITSLGRGKIDFRTATDLARIIRERNIDLLHLHGYGSTNFGIIAAKLTGTKCIVHEHFVDPKMPVYQIPFDFILGRMADYGIAVSRSVKEFMVKKRFMPSAKVEVIYNGAPLKEFKPVPENCVVKERKRWGIDSNDKVVTTIGRVDTQKGGRYLIGAIPVVLKHHPRTKFLVVGDGPLLDELKQMVTSSGIADSVIFTGFHSDIPTIQSLTTIQVFPSLWEGTPLTLFEAMSMRLPIVSTDVDGLGEVLENDKNALVVGSGNSTVLADALCELLDHPEKAESLASAALETSKEYDIQKTVDRMEAVYDQVLKGKVVS